MAAQLPRGSLEQTPRGSRVGGGSSGGGKSPPPRRRGGGASVCRPPWGGAHCGRRHLPPPHPPPCSSAYDVRLRQKVAVKKLSRPFQSLIHARRTYRELRLLKHLKHENVSWDSLRGPGRAWAGQPC